MARSMEIRCTACGRLALVRAEPVYDGFVRTGETFVCTACGKQYADAASTPFVAQQAAPNVFKPADFERKLSIFDESEVRRSCRWCRHFVVSPFDQKCGLTQKTVEATDLCLQFTAKV